MSRRVYEPSFTTSPSTLESFTLSQEESDHLLRVLRLKPGSLVELLNGRGFRGEGTLAIEGRRATLRNFKVHQDETPLRTPWTLGMACLKGQAMDWLVEKLTELGVPRVQLLETDRCIAKPKLQTLERLQRISQQSLKQCGRTFEMQISPPKNLKDALRDAWKDPKNIWVALEPNAHGSTLSLSNLESSFRAPGSPELMIFVGPEGGWSEREITLMKSNSKLRFVDVSPQTLRAETAGILLAALLQSWSSTRESS